VSYASGQVRLFGCFGFSFLIDGSPSAHGSEKISFSLGFLVLENDSLTFLKNSDESVNSNPGALKVRTSTESRITSGR
jgi:hypothetical protein